MSDKPTVADWIKEHADYQSDFCLVFPFFRNPNGYGQMQYQGKRYWAHRLMCEFAHGPAPTPEHEASHSCGNGHGGCCNPRHLSWKTLTENRRDSIAHGTSVRTRNGAKRSLSDEQIQEIWGLKGKMTQQEIADRFGISPPMVRAIFTGKAYAAPSKMNFFTPQEDARIKELADQGKNFSQIARAIGRNPASVATRGKKIGARMNFIQWTKGTDTSKISLV